jgi:hypothetical protein
MDRVEESPSRPAPEGGVDVRFGLGRARVTVRTPDATMADEVARLFRPLVLAVGAPGGTAPIVVDRIGSAWMLGDAASGSATRTRRFGKRSSLLAAVEFMLLRALLAGVAREAHLHASGALVAGRAVVALGASRSGKSSLALGWSRAGRPLLSDEVLRVDDRGRVRGVPRLVKAGRGLLRAHALRETDTVAPDPRTPDVWWDPVGGGGGWSGRGLRPAVVARVSWVEGAATRIDRLPRPEGLRVLLDGLLDSGLGPGKAFERLAGIAETADLVDVRFGSGADAARAVAALAAGARV